MYHPTFSGARVLVKTAQLTFYKVHTKDVRLQFTAAAVVECLAQCTNTKDCSGILHWVEGNVCVEETSFPSNTWLKQAVISILKRQE